MTVDNKGNSAENVTVTAYYNVSAGSVIGVQVVGVSPGENATVIFVWNTSGVPYCHNYTITAFARIPFDDDLSDNVLSDGHVKVRMMCDVNGDDTIDGRDISVAARAFGTVPGDPRWNADLDFNRDGTIDGKDITLVARSFGKSYT